MKQLDLYKAIDVFFQQGTEQATSDVAKSFFENFDAKKYFFNQVPIDWIDWLNKNNFFEELNLKSDSKQYSYMMPELDFLGRVVESKKYLDRVTDIFLTIDGQKNFNPEVIDRTIRIARDLPAEQIQRLAPNIISQNWVYLMRNFSVSSYDYEPILKNLEKMQDNKNLIGLTKILLTVNEKFNSPEDTDFYAFESPFYVQHLDLAEVLEPVSRLRGPEATEALKMLLDILKQIIGKKEPYEDSIFQANDNLLFLDLDLFDVELKTGFSRLDDGRRVLGLITGLIQHIKTLPDETISRFYNEYIETLPDTRITWRLRLFVMSQFPKLLKEKLQTLFWRLFDILKEDKKPYYEVISGTEYKKALIASFNHLDAEYKDKYIEAIFEYLGKPLNDKEKESRRKRDALEILKAIHQSGYAIEKYEQRSIDIFGHSYADERIREITPTIGKVHGGSIHDHSPVTFEEDEYKDIQNIIRDLKGKFTPKQMEETYKNDNPFNPRSLEGVGVALKDNIQKRIDEYLVHAPDFFNEEEIHSHYTYSFLGAIDTYLKNKNGLKNDSWEPLLNLFKKVKNSNPQVIEKDSYLGSWISVKKEIADILKDLSQKSISDETYEKYRTEILNTIEFLINDIDSTKKYEDSGTSDLFHIAINSARGGAFEALISFIYRDGSDVLKGDVKKVYSNLIQTNTSLSIWFMIGHYLASFYYRDQKWFAEQLSIIFNTEDKERFFAIWEGYVSTSLYEELFNELSDCYAFVIKSKSSSIPKRDRFVEPVEGTGTHLALGFAHFDAMDQGEWLFNRLWSEGEIALQKSFISFLGQGIISRTEVMDELLEKRPEILKELKDLWDWVLKENFDPAVYEGFGFWISTDKKYLEDDFLARNMAKTLEKSKGKLEWSYGLTNYLMELAQADAESTLKILNHYILEGILDGDGHDWYEMRENRIDMFKILYEHLPKETENLINRMLVHPKGGHRFWELRKVVD